MKDLTKRQVRRTGEGHGVDVLASSLEDTGNGYNCTHRDYYTHTCAPGAGCMQDSRALISPVNNDVE